MQHNPSFQHILRAVMLVSAPYSPLAYYTVIVSYASVLTAAIFIICNGVAA